MKKFRFILVAVLVMFFASDAAAKGRFGIIGGVNFSQSNIKNWTKENITLYQAGISYQAKLPLGFSIQPSLVYQARGMQLTLDSVKGQLGDLGTFVDKVESAWNEFSGQVATYDLKMGYLELPLAIQWGVDLLVFRPYLEVAPYIGCAIKKPDFLEWDDINRLSCGIGLGGGIEVWKFQVSARYNWSLGPLVKQGDLGTAISNIEALVKDKVLRDANFNGVTLSVALLF